MVEFDTPKKKTKLFYTLETYICEKKRCPFVYVDQYMAECIFNA